MQLIISANDNLDDVLAQLGQLFGRELQVAGPRGLGEVASSMRRTVGAASAGAAGKRTPVSKGRTVTSRGATRGESAAKRTAAVRGKKSAASAAASGAPKLDTTPVRAWARANGHAVSARGRLPAAVLKAYVAAQS